MECTQRLECTQDLNPDYCSQRSGPEQVGYLGICGNTYPVKIGPNKIGRDPQTCDIVLNMKSLSRQHAVINVIGHNKKEYMLMDLGSVNKTKLGIKTLQPYIPYPMQNGDTVQFGDVFGIFRLFEDETDLPMTQDIGIPDTPVPNRHIPKLGNSVFTTVPESPDVSDKDDSFIMSSQQPKDHEFKSPSSHFIKNSGKTILRPAIGSNKINNIFWTSSKNSPSLKLCLDESIDSLNNSSSSANNTVTVNTVLNISKDVHEMETQIPTNSDEPTDPIYTANTQLPSLNDSASIHNLETQLPTIDNLPQIYKINDQQEMQFELSVANKENDTSIHNAHTQLFEIDDVYNAETTNTIRNNNIKSIHDMNTQLVQDSSSGIHNAKTQSFEHIKKNENSINELNTQVVNKDNSSSIHEAKTQVFIGIQSDKEELEFENNDSFKKDNKDNDKISHTTISESDEEMLLNEFDGDENEIALIKTCETYEKTSIKPLKINESDDEILFDDVDGHNFDDNLDSQPLLAPDISPSKCSDKENMPIIRISEESCSPIIGGKKTNKRRLDSDSSSDCENLAILPTQIVTKVPVDDDATDCEDDIFDDKSRKKTSNEEIHFEDTQIVTNEDLCFEDQPTQILEDIIKPNSEDCFANMATQIVSKEQEYSEEIISPFKIPFMSPKKMKRKEIGKGPANNVPLNQSLTLNNKNEDKYYAATQDIIDDLNTQKDDDVVITWSVESELSPKKKLMVTDKSSESSDAEDKIDQYVSSLSVKQVNDVVGANIVSILAKKTSSDLSDLEITPKKKRPFKFMNVELPNSQEIKISVSQTLKPEKTESSSESEQEGDSQECTPILFKKKIRSKIRDAKIDLTAKFDSDALPTRVITRVRKPTSKVLESIKKSKDSIPKFLTEQEDNIDKDIISENITRLKNNRKKANDKSKHSPETNKESDRKHETSDKSKTKETNKSKHSLETKKESDRKHETSDKSKTKKTKTSSRKKKDNTIESHTKSNERNKLSKSSEKDRSTTKKSTQPAISEKTKEENISKLTSEKEGNKTEMKSKNGRGRPRKDTKTPEKTLKEQNKSSTKEDTRPKNSDEPPIHHDETDNIRRSKRQRNTNTNDKSKNYSQTETLDKKSKSTNKGTKPVLKSILKLTEVKQDSSAVYSISSESSSAESPKSVKRPAHEPLEGFAKRTRSAASVSVKLRSTPVRAAKTQYVLFTAFPNEAVKSILEKLGAVIVTDVKSCTVLVTLQIKRTFKLLCVVGLGKPIVGPSWVQACADTNTVVDPWLYLMHDETAENRFHFSLDRTLNGKRNFLEGYNVSATPSVMPSAPEMKLIVECSGGTWKEGGSAWICISCKEDKTMWGSLRRKGAILVSTELILGGVLRQILDIDGNRLKFAV